MADGNVGDHETAHDRLREEGAMARDENSGGGGGGSFIGGFGFGPDNMQQSMKGFTEMFGKGLGGMGQGFGPWANVQKVMMEWTRKQVEDAVNTSQKLGGCRNAADVVSLQMELLHRSFERGQSHTTEVMNLVRDAFVNPTGGEKS